MRTCPGPELMVDASTLQMRKCPPPGQRAHAAESLQLSVSNNCTEVPCWESYLSLQFEFVSLQDPCEVRFKTTPSKESLQLSMHRGFKRPDTRPQLLRQGHPRLRDGPASIFCDGGTTCCTEEFHPETNSISADVGDSVLCSCLM